MIIGNFLPFIFDSFSSFFTWGQAIKHKTENCVHRTLQLKRYKVCVRPGCSGSTSRSIIGAKLCILQIMIKAGRSLHCRSLGTYCYQHWSDITKSHFKILWDQQCLRWSHTQLWDYWTGMSRPSHSRQVRHVKKWIIFHEKLKAKERFFRVLLRHN